MSIVFTFGLASASSQVAAKWPPHPLLILLSRVTDLALLMVCVEGLTVKYAFMAFIHQMASLVSPEKSVGRAALILVVLVVVDIGFAGGRSGLTGG